MKIYKINAWWYNEDEMDHTNITEYLVHKDEYSKEKFSKICREALTKCKDKYMYDLTSLLKEQYGFDDIEYIAEFEFDEED